MQTEWAWSPELEAKRVAWTCKNIAEGWYRNEGFVVVPEGSRYRPGNSVVLPEMRFTDIPRYWEKVKRINTTNILNREPVGVEKTVEYLLLARGETEPEVQALKDKWAGIQETTIAQMYEVLPWSNRGVSRLRIFVTRYGTAFSFNVPKNFPAEVRIWLRADMGINELIRAMVASLSRVRVRKQYRATWAEAQLISDCLVGETRLGLICPESNRTAVAGGRAKNAGKWYQRSEEFLRRIGADSKGLGWRESVKLSGRDLVLWEAMTGKGVLSLDEIADILYAGDDEAYSLYGAAKAIQKLRDSLEKQGIPGGKIKNIRGKGYLAVG